MTEKSRPAKSRSKHSVSSLELRMLGYFDTVAELGSISRAAAALHMTQPTLSRQLSQLESIVGEQLLHRTTRGTALTPAGEGLHEQVGVIMGQIDRIPDVIRASQTKQEVLHMSIPSGIPIEWFHNFHRALRKRIPRIRVSLHEATTQEQRRMLLTRTIDIGLLHTEPPELNSEWIFQQPLGFAVRDPRRFYGRSSISLEDLRDMRVLAQSTQSEKSRLRAAAALAGIQINWDFRKFSVHSQLIADTVEADAILLGQASASERFSHWEWLPMQAEPEISTINTWAAWADAEQPLLKECLAAIREVSGKDT